MAQYTWNGGGGAFNDASMWTVNGQIAKQPPGSSDTADFASGGSPTGGGDVAAISVEGAATFSAGTITTGTLSADAAVTVDAGGDLDSTGNTSFSDGLTVKQGGEFESNSASFNGGSVTIDGGDYTDEANFVADGTTAVTVSNGADVETGAGPGDLDVIETGSLSVTSDATLTVADLTTFNGTTWSIDQDAELDALGGGNLAGAGLVGVLLNGTGSIDGATLETQAGFTVGGEGYEGVPSTGDATIEGGADTSAGVLILGDYHTDEGTLELTGAGTKLTLASSESYTGVPGTALIGNDGQGTLEIEDGAELDETCGSGGFASIAYASDGTGEATVEGDDSSWTISGTLNVGDGGMGTLTVESGGAVTVNGGDDEGDVTVGAQNTATGVVEIETGGSFDISSELQIGQQPTAPSSDTTPGDFGTGSVTVTGSGSTLSAGNMTVGGAIPTPTSGAGDWTYSGGVGTLTISSDGSVSVDDTLDLATRVEPGADATASAQGGINIGGGGSLEIGGQGGAPAWTLQVDDGGSLTGYGLINSGVTGQTPVGGDGLTTPTYSLSIDNSGTIEAQNGALVLHGNVSGAGQFLVGQGSTLEFGGTVAEDVTAMFLPSGDGTSGDATIAIDDPDDFQGVISSENLEPGDMIDLPNVPYIAPGSDDLNPEGASFQFETGEDQQNYVLQVVEDDQTYNIPINQDEQFTGGFTLSDDGSGGTLVTLTADDVSGYSTTATADGAPSEVYKGVVDIEFSNGPPSATKPNGGTGFIIGPGLVLTAAHVVINPTTHVPYKLVEVSAPGRADRSDRRLHRHIRYCGESRICESWFQSRQRLRRHL